MYDKGIFRYDLTPHQAKQETSAENGFHKHRET